MKLALAGKVWCDEEFTSSLKGTSKNPNYWGPQKTAQMLGDRKPATAAYTVVREDCGRSGQQRRWAVFGGPLI